MKGTINRLLKKSEYGWLYDDIAEGTEVYKYYGATYGCIGYDGVAVTLEQNKIPFFEVPNDVVVWEDE